MLIAIDHGNKQIKTVQQSIACLALVPIWLYKEAPENFV